MSNCNKNKNPLQHNGTSQAERLPEGLRSNYVNVNEKGFEDWIVFAAEFSKYLNYYDLTGTTAGNWSPFFNNDISALLGTIAVQDIETYRQEIKFRFDFIKEHDNAADLTQVKENLNQLFSAALTLSKSLDTYLLKLPESTPKDPEEENIISLKRTLQNIVQSKLSPALQRLIAYWKTATTLGYLSTGNLPEWKILNTQLIEAGTIIDDVGLSDSWLRNNAASWEIYKNGIAADATIFGDPLWLDDYRRINHAINHNLFASIFDQYLQAYSKIINEALKELLKTLGDWDSHPAHYALFLSFLKLFRFAQSHINSITRRHLDFYYKEVLQLFPKKAEPDKAHVIIELAKYVDEYVLKQGELMKAGKDSEGKEVLYALEKETTFNKAKISSLKSVYKGDASGADDLVEADGTTVISDNKQRLFASQVANSADGAGAKLVTENKEWHPFINKVFEEGQLTAITMPLAQIGFAIASHYLFLTEGERNIIIRLAAGAGNTLLYNKAVDCYLTTEKEWYLVPADFISAIAAGTMSDTTACAEFTISLPGDVTAITNYVAKIHGGSFNVEVPVLKVILRNESSFGFEYDQLKDIVITKTEVKVEVGDLNAFSQTGLKQLLLSNDFGPLDASKPFQPFGGQPRKDMSLLIGNKELFSKKNASFRLNIEWADLPGEAVKIDYDPDNVNQDFYPYTKLRYLSEGKWTDLVADLNIFNEAATQVVIPETPLLLPEKVIEDYETGYDTYQVNDRAGFIKISLKGDFGHKTYLKAITTYLIEKATEDATQTYPDEPFEPYTPTIQSLYVSYTANVVQPLTTVLQEAFDNREIKFFHLYPFGEAEQHTYLSGEDVNLMPQFSHGAGAAKVHFVGEFYIGVQNLAPLQSVNILFQVMEGTADPLLIKPEKHIYWSFLSNNRWIDFEDQEISDATAQLIQSGIISFVIPAEATIVNTLLPSGYIWLKAAVGESAEAVCKLLTVDAQAAVVVFQPNNGTANFPGTPLPAGTVSKLKVPDSAVKKLIQPYPSIGGKAKETEDKFYTRVSERLRHKDRAITIWDYEHLVLEHFPQIYKAKCLNHTKLEENELTGEMEYNEVAPGYVTVITIPALQNRNDTNPLRPYTNQGELLAIEAFLTDRISCHVKLGVRNPHFEEVKLKFRLRLIQGFDDFTFYKKQLQQEITQFLTPWAYSGEADISFGGKVYKSVLIDFIEERPYVDFITEVQMFHNVDELTPGVEDLDEITASTARSILVSVQASKHDIEQIDQGEDAVQDECTASAASVNNL
jgi:hypothetical protein